MQIQTSISLMKKFVEKNDIQEFRNNYFLDAKYSINELKLSSENVKELKISPENVKELKHIKKKKFNTILKKSRLFLPTVTILLLMMLFGVTIYFFLAGKKQTQHLDVTNFEFSTTNDKTDLFLLNHSRVYLYVQSIYEMIEKAREENGNLHYSIEEIVTNSFYQANTFGITDILISESSLKLEKDETEITLTSLTRNSAAYSIRIGLLLDEQFTFKSWEKYSYKREILARGVGKCPLKIDFRYVFDPKSYKYQDLIQSRIKTYVQWGLRNFIIGDRPFVLIPTSNTQDFYITNRNVDYKLLDERSNFILNSSENISLFYLYDDEDGEENIIGQKVKYQGGVFKVEWDIIDKFLLEYYVFDRGDLEYFTKMFQPFPDTYKVLLLNILIFKDELGFINILIGLYLFSPVPIILRIDDSYSYEFFNNILNHEDNIMEKCRKQSIMFRKILELRRNEPFFKHRTRLLEDIRFESHIFIAVRGTYDQSKKEMIFLLYHNTNEEIEVDIYSIFSNYSFKHYSIIYDGSFHNISANDEGSGRIKLFQRHILVIKPNLDY